MYHKKPYLIGLERSRAGTYRDSSSGLFLDRNERSVAYNKELIESLSRKMKDVPLMPRATAVWLVENTTITFKQIAEFCNLHELEVKGIADGDVAKGIKAYNPILAGQLTREEIEESSKDKNRPLKLNKKFIEIRSKEKKRPKYTPLSKRQDRPDAIHWMLKNHPRLSDGQISKLVGTTKNTASLIRNKTYWNFANLSPKDPVAINLCSQLDIQKALEKNERKINREKKKIEKEQKLMEDSEKIEEKK